MTGSEHVSMLGNYGSQGGVIKEPPFLPERKGSVVECDFEKVWGTSGPPVNEIVSLAVMGLGVENDR
ncbi:hypothetical protein AVEN_132577-1 [Araneus ventricosus]|uniref:Uncharacterized protein n=1 Tax=Araneus ventricosus TaxID=182803 RepID=A0A4Y2T519_ARAVE|nr:hypothetical protein AVEN_132577-1 [Araneus ventricosus]